jgi:hypothetical protein
MQTVDKNQDKTVKNFETLKAKFLGPMAKLYGKAMKRGGTIFERLGSVEDAVKGISDDGNLFGAVSFLGGLTQGGEFGLPWQVNKLKRCMNEL